MRPVRPAFFRYAWSAVTVLTATGLSLALGPFVDRTAVVFFAAAVAFTAWFGGLGPALMATILGVAAIDYFLLPPVGSFEVGDPEHLVDLLVFGVVAISVSSLSRHLLAARRRVEAARAAADAERERAVTILESISDAFLALDRDWRYVYLNTKAASMAGRGLDELLGKRIWDVYPQLIGSALERGARRAMDERVGLRLEYRTSVAGTWFDVGAYPSEQGLSLYFQDITARKQAEQAVHEQREWLETTLASIGDAVVATDSDGRVRFINPVAERLTGWPRAEAVGTAIDDIFVIVNEETRTPVESPIATALLEGVVTGLANHTLLLARDGKEWPIDDSGAPIRSTDGVVIGAVLVFREITERRRDEERLRFLAQVGELLNASLEYQATLQTLARLAVPVLADWSAIDMVQADGSVERLAVEHQDRAKVELAHELQRRYPPDPDSPAGVPLVLRTGRPAFYPEVPDELLVAAARDEEHLRIARDLGLRSVIIVPLTARGRTLGAGSFVSAESGRRYDADDLAFAEDLAHRAALAVDNARLFGEAQRAQRLAEEALRLRDTFISVVTHDLRNPLAGIKGYAQLLRRRGAYSEQAVDRIEAQAQLLERLIGDLADVASLQEGRLELRPQRVDLIDLVRDSLDQVQHQSGGRRLHLSAPGTALEGEWDPDRLGQVLQNLLTNAVKYSPDGGDVGVAIATSPGRVQVSIRDEGVGIPAGALPRLFDQYYRVEEQRSAPGLGLGLYITRSLIEAHGGRIWAESAGPGQGSTFHFTLPWRPIEEAGPSVPEAAH